MPGADRVLGQAGGGREDGYRGREDGGECFTVRWLEFWLKNKEMLGREAGSPRERKVNVERMSQRRERAQSKSMSE